MNSYITKSAGKGVFGYRRRVPAEIKQIIGRREIKRSLKTSDIHVARIEAAKLNMLVEAQFATAWKQVGRQDRAASTALSPSQAYQMALSGFGDADRNSDDAKDGYLMYLCDKFERVGLSAIEEQEVRILQFKDAPIPSVSEMMSFYRDYMESLTQSPPTKRKSLEQIDRATKLLSETLGADRSMATVGIRTLIRPRSAPSSGGCWRVPRRRHYTAASSSRALWPS